MWLSVAINGSKFHSFPLDGSVRTLIPHISIRQFVAMISSTMMSSNRQQMSTVDSSSQLMDPICGNSLKTHSKSRKQSSPLKMSSVCLSLVARIWSLKLVIMRMLSAKRFLHLGTKLAERHLGQLPSLWWHQTIQRFVTGDFERGGG